MSEVTPRGREARQLSRRRFIRTTCATSAAILGTNLLPSFGRAASTAPTTAPADRFQIDGGLVTLPSKGTLYIANDFHTRHADFDRWLKRTDLVAKLKNAEDVYGLVLGDVIDEKPLDKEAEQDGDSRILDRIREIQHGPGGGRLIYILGNHELEVMSLYHVLKTKVGMNVQNRKRIIQALYKMDGPTDYTQWNFIERITDEQEAWFRTLPVAVLCANGVLAVHAGPPRNAARNALAHPDADTVNDVVWRRPTEEKEIDAAHARAYYNKDDVAGALKALDEQLIIVGHTPVALLPPELVHNGLCYISDRAVVMAASYGALPGQKHHLVIDLAKKYRDVSDLILNEEIRPMAEPQASLFVKSVPLAACLPVLSGREDRGGQAARGTNLPS